MINRAYLILGGNIGNRAAMLEEAQELLRSNGILVTGRSSLYETAPWQMRDCGNFLNRVLEAETSLSAPQLMQVCLEIEKTLGRTRDGVTYQPRSIDIDILFFNSDVMDTTDLQIPHPRLHLRRFALVPMLELNAGLVHPLLGKTIEELLHSCPDTNEVNAFSAV